MYKTQRNYENAQRMLFDGVGQYDILEIEPTQFESLSGLIMPRVRRIQRVRQYISFWTITNLPEYGQTQIDTFRCYSDLSSC